MHRRVPFLIVCAINFCPARSVPLGFRLVRDVDALRHSIDELQAATQTVELNIFVPDGLHFDLNGAVFNIGPHKLSLVSNGTLGAIFDANSLCRHFVVGAGGQLRLTKITLVNGVAPLVSASHLVHTSWRINLGVIHLYIILITS